MKSIAVAVCLLVAVADVALSFGLNVVSNRIPMSIHAESSDSSEPVWDGTRTPVTTMERLDQAMDATWGRGKFRTEVWDGDVNPINDWWTAYAPSAEEVSAASMGFNFREPKAWFEVSSKAIYPYIRFHDIFSSKYRILLRQIFSRTTPQIPRDFTALDNLI